MPDLRADPFAAPNVPFRLRGIPAIGGRGSIGGAIRGSRPGDFTPGYRGISRAFVIRDSGYRPARDRYKIYILDEAHQITDAAFNALLKTLEEPPGHIVFMMATTQPEDIPQTIRSRCQHFSFHAVRFDEIVRQLRDLAAQENIKAEEDALALLAEQVREVGA